MPQVRRQLAYHLTDAEIRVVPAAEDPLDLQDGEEAWSVPLRVDGEQCLPLRYADDERDARNALASLVGALTAAQAGERVIARVGASRVKNSRWFDRYRHHLLPAAAVPGKTTSWWSVVLKVWMAGIVAAAALGLVSTGDRGLEAGVIWAALAFVGGGLLLLLVWLVVRRPPFSPDEEDLKRMRRKIVGHVYDSALEVVVILPLGGRIERASEVVDGLVDAYRWFEVVDKRAIRRGRIRGRKMGYHSEIWNFGRGRTVLGAEELAALWHLPDAELRRRISGTAAALVGGGDGAFVGTTTGPDSGIPVHFPDGQLGRHMFILAGSGMGKSTLMQHIVEYKMRLKAQGRDNAAIVVIDPHSDLIDAILPLVPESLVETTRLIDLGNAVRLPGINLIDAHIFTHRERVVDALIGMFQAQWAYLGTADGATDAAGTDHPARRQQCQEA